MSNQTLRLATWPANLSRLAKLAIGRGRWANLTRLATGRSYIGGQVANLNGGATKGPGGKTSPEELLAASQASCYAMALSHTLAQQGTPPQRLRVTAACTFDPAQGKVTTMEIHVRGSVPGLDQTAFAAVASKGEQACPIANALRGNVEIRLTAELEV